MLSDATSAELASDEADEILAEQIADVVLELAKKPGAHRLAAMQMAGLAGERPSHADIARAFNLTPRQVRTAEQRAFAYIAFMHPELRLEIRRGALNNN